MSDAWVNQEALKLKLGEFFAENRDSLSTFGSTVNQTFEAFVFASVVAWYRRQGWTVSFEHPKSEEDTQALRLKFSTRGRPSGYTYALCRKGRRRIQVRHQLRVSTRFHDVTQQNPANICLDVAVLKSVDLSSYSTNDALPIRHLITFGEAKHMSAFAELIAGFIGVVHEMQPRRLKRGARHRRSTEHLAPFLYVSGHLYTTGQGIFESIERRGCDLDIYCSTKALTDQIDLPTDGRVLQEREHLPTPRSTGRQPRSHRTATALRARRTVNFRALGDQGG